MSKDNETKRSDKKNRFVKALALWGVVILLGSSMAFMLNYNDKAGDELIKDKTIGDRLDDAGWMLFVSTGCPACEMQKDIIGSDISGLKVVDCAASLENNQLCFENSIRVIPTWHNVFSNETVEGVVQISQIEEMAK